MRRREFIAGIAGTVAWTISAEAQPSGQSVIGVLSGGSENGYRDRVDAMGAALREMGFTDQSLVIEYRWADNKFDRLPDLASDLVRRQVAVIVTAGGTATAMAAKAATGTIPIVFAVGGDPVASGLVSNLSKPGGNITGVVGLSELLITKRFELMRELLPSAKVIAFLLNPEAANTPIRRRDVEEAAQKTGEKVLILYAKSFSEFDSVFDTLTQERIDGLIVADDPVFNSARELMGKMALQRAVPTIYQYKDFALAGGLISYGGDAADMYHQVGIYVARILRGESPAALPIVQPSRFELIVNLRTAKALGLTIPPSLLAQADEVIE